jgi:hypothetical protein
MDAAIGYETHLLEGGKMMITLAGAMSTGEVGCIACRNDTGRVKWILLVVQALTWKKML